MADESSKSERKRVERRRQILAATLHLVREYGTGISTAQVAARAHCSKETLYAWFSDRDGLFDALIAEQGAAMVQAMEIVNRRYGNGGDRPPRERLILFGLGLLDIATGDAAIVVNRIAMARTCRANPASGEAVRTIWQTEIASRFSALVEAAGWQIPEVEDAWQTYVGLLVGDRQRLALLGDVSRPGADTMQAIAERAADRWLTLYDIS